MFRYALFRNRVPILKLLQTWAFRTRFHRKTVGVLELGRVGVRAGYYVTCSFNPREERP